MAATGDGDEIEFTFFELADTVAVNYVMGDHTQHEDEDERQREVLAGVLAKLTHLISRFNRATFSL